MTSKELREKYIKFFIKKGHQEIPSASLVPENDPTVLFTTAGMHPLVPYLMGEKHPKGKRLVSVQKCARTGDIEDVGDSTHNTFFEMLGNWSLGDYFKEDSIRWSWEFLTDKKWLGISPEKIKVTVFEGDSDSPKDEESIKIWQECFKKSRISFEVYDKKKKNNKTARIFPLPKKDNWWGPAGETGPCGPDTEIFIDLGKPVNFEKCPNSDDCKPGCNCGRYVEIWNNVFMEFGKKKRTVLVDGMHCLYDKEFRVNKKLLNLIDEYKEKKILVVNGHGKKAAEVLNGHGFEIFTFEKEITKDNKIFFLKLIKQYKLNPEEIIYIEHKADNIKGANKAGIEKAYLYDLRVNIQEEDIKRVRQFIDKNFYFYKILKQKNVDTGMGLERILAILNGFDNVYETDLFAPVVTQVKSQKSKVKSQKLNEKKSIRIIADHIRTSVFMISDGVAPSNLDRGYVLRKLLRRAIRHGNLLKMPNGFLFPLAKTVIDIYKKYYPELENNKSKILDEIKKETEKFEKTLEKGIKELKKIYGRAVGGIDPENLPEGTIIQNNVMRADGKKIFHIYETYGLPIEMSQEIMKEWGIAFDEQTIKEAKEAFKKHQELSRTASAGMFKGGLVDAGEQAIKYHTATHLLLESLRRILGNHIYQKGSNINDKRLRFDFSHSEKLTDKEKQKVENLVNEQIQKKLPISCEEMSLKKAKELGAIGVFDSKYGDKVKVYTIGDDDNVFSREICGGPHIKNISELGKFKIKKEQSSSAGVRRIKAVLE